MDCTTANYAQLPEVERQTRTFSIGGVPVGGARLTVIAGPCAIESGERLAGVADEIIRLGADMLRGGAFKARTSPHSFQGLGEQGLRALRDVRDRYRVPAVSEVMQPSQVALFCEHADVLQVGARNMQNFELLRELGRCDCPVLLKRGFGNTIDELLLSAEYIAAEGNERIILCERGIRTFEPRTRGTLDLSAVPVLKRLATYPVFVDPSHAAGQRGLVGPLALAAVAVGADGLMLEVHDDPENALCDGAQSLDIQAFGRLMEQLRAVAAAVGRSLGPRADA